MTERGTSLGCIETFDDYEQNLLLQVGQYFVYKTETESGISGGEKKFKKEGKMKEKKPEKLSEL